jgi:hypothetical protein
MRMDQGASGQEWSWCKSKVTLLAKVIGKWELPKNIRWIANMYKFAQTCILVLLEPLSTAALLFL